MNYANNVRRIVKAYTKATAVHDEAELVGTEEAKAKAREVCLKLSIATEKYEKIILKGGGKVYVNIQRDRVYVRIQMPSYWSDTVTISKRVESTYLPNQGSTSYWVAPELTWGSGGHNSTATNAEVLADHLYAIKLGQKIIKDFEELTLDDLSY